MIMRSSSVFELKSLSIFLISVILIGVQMLILSPSISGEDDVGNPVTRSSTGEIIEKDFDVQFMIEPSYDILDPYSGEKWAKLSPGEHALYWVIVSNIGSYNDTYNVTLIDPPRDNGWDWYFADNGLTYIETSLTSTHLRDEYGGKTFSTFLVQVISPIDAGHDNEYKMIVNATSRYALNNGYVNRSSDGDELVLVTHDIDTIPLRNEDQFFHAPPGEWVSIPINITNLGNKDVIEVQTIIEEDDYWRTSYRDFEEHYYRKPNHLEFNWTSMNVSIYKGQTIHLELSFRAPVEWADQGDIFQFRYLGVIEGTNYWMSSEIITLFVGDPFDYYEYHNFTDINETDPDDNSTGNITIENRSPIPVISSPSEYIEYFRSDMIIFDGSRSFDLDNDNLSFLWYSDRDGYLGTGPVLLTSLSQDEHLITLHLFDGEFNVTESVRIIIQNDPEALDTDMDGIPDIDDMDDDNDGLPDQMEDINGNGIFEFYLGETDPLNPDTDGDGANDENDDDPLDPTPPPVEESDEIQGTTILIFVISAIVLIILTAVTTYVIMRSSGRIEE